MMSDTEPTIVEDEASPSVAATGDVVTEVPHDPWAVDETEASTPVDEAVPESNETTKAISRLKESTFKLGSVLSSNTASLDQKLGISNAFSAIGLSVMKVDEDIKVSKTVKSAGSSIGSWFSNSFSAIDQKFQVTTKSKDIGTSISAAINEVVPPELIGNAVKGLSNFDQAHGITKTTAITLAAGADLLAESLPSPSAQQAAAPPKTDDSLMLDEDGIPTSFIKPTDTPPNSLP